MFEQSDASPKDYKARYAEPVQKEAEEGSPEAELIEQRHDTLMTSLKEERDRQAENRYQMSKDEDYYDGLQWEPEDAQVLMDRGQAPVVFNKIKPTTEWVLGTEKRTRVDYKILPRTPDDEQSAEVKGKVLKYVSDVNRVPFHRSMAFKEAVLAGLGWLEDGAARDPSRDIVYSGTRSWRDVYRDSRDRTFDLSLSRYLFAARDVDLDIAKAIFPKAASALTYESEDNDRDYNEDDIWYLGDRLTNAQEQDSRGRFGERSAFIAGASVDRTNRKTVRLIECWYRVPETAPYFASGPAANKLVNPADPLHAEMLRAGVPTFNHVALRMRCMIATEGKPLWDGPSPYRHDRFPLTPIWCYRRARDGEPYGVVRGIRDIQDDFNKRRSKALYMLSTNRITADSNAFEDIEQARVEANRVDGVVLKKPGSTVEYDKGGDFRGNLELMMQDDALMQDVSGIQSELMGKQTNAQSGKAILARQEQGSMVTAGIFDNLRLAIQMQGEVQLSLIEQFYTEEKVIRLAQPNKAMEWLPINKFDPQTGQILNDITARQADFVVSEQDYRASMQQAAAESLGEVLVKVGQFAPQVVMTVLDLWVDLLEIPNKDEFVGRLRKATGQRDPAAKESPEELQAAQAQAQEAQEQKEFQKRMAMAQLETLLSKADKTTADAMRVRVQAMLDAMNAGQVVSTVPGVTPVADSILQSSGFQDQQGADPNIPSAGQPAPMPPAMPGTNPEVMSNV